MKIPVFLAFIGLVEGNFKHWKYSTNFENGENWDIGRPPCKNDRLIFPEAAPPVFVQSNATIHEIVLPSNGELVLGSFSSISFSPSASIGDECEGKDITFTRSEAKSWFDPNNWCQALDPEGDCQTIQPNVLDTEKVPCKYEGVTFPLHRSFLVNIGAEVDISISALRLGGKGFSTGTFRNYLDSSEGKKQFIRRDGQRATVINIQDHSCSDPTGCACGNDEGLILEKVCNIQSKNCPMLRCSDVLHPTGGCCDICGAIVTMEYNDKFKLSSLKNMVEDVVEDSNNGVNYIVSKTKRDQIQVVLQDGGDGSRAAAVGQIVKDKLDKDASGRNKYGTHSVELETSRGVRQATAAPQISKPVGKNVIVGIVIAILLFLVAMGLALFCFLFPARRRATSDGLKKAFKNIGRSNSDYGLELASSVSFKEPHVALGGFDNPLYDSPLKYSEDGSTGNIHPSMVAPPYTPQMSPETLGDLGHANPLYGQGVVEEMNDSHNQSHCTSPTSSIEDGGFSNPVYAIQQLEEAYSQDPTLKFNPAFNPEGIDDDSPI